MGALTLQAEVCDWRRFGRAASFMGFVGLVPKRVLEWCEHPPRPPHQSRQRRTFGPSSSKSAWSYQHRPYVGPEIAKRHESLAPEVLARAWGAQLRLCGRFRHLAARKNSKSVVAARSPESLAGFLWAEMGLVR